MTIGERIKKQRKLKKLSQEDLAKRIGLKHSAISKYENNQIILSVDQIYKIAAALDIEPHKLFFDKEVESIHDLSEEDFLDAIQSLQSEGNSSAAAFIESQREAILAYRDWRQASDEFNSFLEINNKNTTEREKSVMTAFRKLNEDGQTVAINRVEELTEIPRYQKKPKEKPQTAGEPSEAE